MKWRPSGAAETGAAARNKPAAIMPALSVSSLSKGFLLANSLGLDGRLVIPSKLDLNEFQRLRPAPEGQSGN